MTANPAQSASSNKHTIIDILNSRIMELGKNPPQYGTVSVELVLHAGEVVRIITKIDRQEQVIA
jgi:hypothetical protein